MNNHTSRRSVLKGIGGGLAATVGIAATGTATAETSRTAGAYYSGTGVQLEGVSYDSATRKGALVEDLVYEDPSAGVIGDIHYVIHDGVDTYNTRDDASAGEVGVTAAQLEEVYLDTTIPVSGGDAGFYQQALVTETDNAPAALIDNELTLPAGGDYTITTLANPEFGDQYNEASLTSQGYYDVFVATDGTYYAAFAQRESWRKAFDDQHVGVEGVASGEDKSAWRDAYVEGDATLDTNEYNDGDIDLAFSLYGGDVTELNWTTAVGLGYDEAAAVDRAVSALENGFDAERTESYW